MTDIPAIAPVPADFAPVITADAKAMRWRSPVTIQSEGSMTQVTLETGYPLLGIDSAVIYDRLRNEAWTILEYARLGRADLLASYSTKRHAGHPVSIPAT